LNIGINTEFWPLFSRVNFQNAGTVKERTDEIHDAFSRKDIDLIFCTQWWHNSNDLLSELDFNHIKKNWKPFFGISDITVLLNSVYAKTNKPAYHGYDLVWQIWLNARKASMDAISDC
jgi:muramoyltetrapeptide carboxypeptidase LdcA involved in peptidoglycan recycling